MKHIVAVTRNRTTGFALVVTLSLMMLLTIIGIGFLSLASISLRSSSQGTAMATARANARMSLILAIGQLQLQAGPDTRVTARADILDENHPPVLGAWRSWEGTNHETSGPFIGRPKSPVAAPGAYYRDAKESRFLAWLTSADSAQSLLASVPPTEANKKITLLGKGSVGSGTDPVTDVDRDKLQIHLPPTLVSSGKHPGGMAWWIGGENQKARLPKPEADAPRGAAARKQAVTQAKSHATVDPKPFGLESVLADPKRGRVDAEVNKSLTLAQVDLLTPSQSNETPESRRSREFYHDLSTDSVGLLTNTATGGWRKDMSLLSEKWDDSKPPTSVQPFFRLSPDPVANTEGTFAELSTAGMYRNRSLFYPWSNYARSDWLRQPVASWNNLMDYVTFYKRGLPGSTVTDINNVINRTTGVRSVTAWAWNGSLGDNYPQHLHKTRIFPVVARVQWVFSHFAVSAGPDPSDSSQELFTPKLLMTPVITMWNPYNVELTLPHNFYFEFKVIPVALSYQVGSTSNTLYNCVLYTNNFTRPTTNIPCLLDYDGGAGMYNTCGFPAGLVLKAGETKVLSPASNDRKTPNGIGGPWGATHTLDLLPGYRGSGGHLYPVRNQNGVVTAQRAATRLKAHISFDTEYFMNWGTNGVGTYFEIRTKDPERYVAWMRTGYSANVARALHPRIEGNEALEVLNLQELTTNPKPFFSTVFGPRLATSIRNTVNPQHNPKGFAQSSPFTHFPHATFRKPNQTPNPYHQYSGTGHPINFGFEFSYVTHKSGVDDNFPNSGPADTGYIISGVQSANGVPRAVIADLPSRPLASLGELVGWDLRFENPVPPFALNLVGNSDASPLLPSNAVINSAEANKLDNFRHDDSYCANHLLFDDWFFSSITEDPATFGGLARSQAAVYGEFVTGVTPLANRAYKPLLEDQAFVASNPSAKLYADYVNTNDSWKTIASRLEVEGMFNVNSTSVTAWRSLLGHARNQKVVHLTSTGNYTGDSIAKQHPVSRFPISGEVEAGSAVPGAFLEASQVTGYRTLTDAFLDDLAEEVVKQVRLRGPFLSLAEFINRQLSSGDLALAGALQAALNELTKEGAANNPLATIQGLSSKTVKNPPEGAIEEDKIGYVFPEAAEGYSSYGVPGWTRQADILRPLAPILTARDDTFVIRGYGDARDTSGKVTATAVCEAVVRRTRNYVDAADAAETTAALTREVNKKFGRRFEIISFRWLSHEEV